MSLHRSVGSIRTVVLLAIIAALGVGLVWQRTGAIGDEPRKEVNRAALRHAEELSEAFNAAAEIGLPSVVTIRSKTKAHPVARGRGNAVPRGENPFKGTPFEDFFNGHNFEDGAPQPNREGMGSGVIIDPSGIVLTNNHVVEGADEVVVHLADGRQFKGEEIKSDEHTDLAIVRIRGAGTLPSATMGDSDKLKIGDWVLAIGNPFELEQTVSAGIISGVGRELGGGRSTREMRARFLQTDAAINPGNSGGPLINMHGEVIGINTAIATNNGSFQGIGFAIPINLAKWVTGQLINKGSVQRAYLGIKLNELTADLAEKLNAHRGGGVLVAQVYPNTPAAQAGFEAGDVITKFGGEKVRNGGELQALVERTALDTEREVEVLRDGKTMTLKVTAKVLPKDFGTVAGERRPERKQKDESASFDAEDLGLEVSDVALDKAEELGVQPNGGVVITKVNPQKPAYEEGLRDGMVILKVGKKAVKNVEEFKAALKEESIKEGVLLYVHTRTGNSFVLIKD